MKFLRKLFVIGVLLTIGFTSFGQGTQNVTIGSTHTYSIEVVAGVNYTWAVTSGGTTTDYGSVTANTIDILWDGTVGTYTISVYGTDANGCITETRSADITIVQSANLAIATLSGDVTTCSDLLDGSSGGLATQSIFELNITDGVAPYDVTYEIRDASNAVVGTAQTITGLNNGDDITIDNNFVNTSGASVDYTFVITGAVTSDGVAVNLGDVSRTITVNSKPVISNLTLN